MDATTPSKAYGRDYRFRPPSQASPAPPSTQQASVDPDAAGARRAPGRDTTKRIPPLLHPFPPDDAPSAASEVLPLPKRHRGLQQTCSAPNPSPGRTDAFRHSPSPIPRPRPPRRQPVISLPFGRSPARARPTPRSTAGPFTRLGPNTRHGIPISFFWCISGQINLSRAPETNLSSS